jgi:hypothetical protein
MHDLGVHFLDALPEVLRIALDYETVQLFRLAAARLRLVDESSQASGGLGLIELDDGSLLGKIRVSLRFLIELTFDLKWINI